jgi:hypothetical protein
VIEMKKVFAGISLFLILFVFVSTAAAQLPTLQVYFRSDYSWTEWSYTADCPPAGNEGVIDTLYFVAEGFDSWLAAIEFRIDYPPEIIWIVDMMDPGALTLGYTPFGIGMAWTLPFNAFEPAVIGSALIMWNCVCSGGGPCGAASAIICPDVYPSSGRMRALRWPDRAFIDAQPGGALICPYVCGGAQPALQLSCPQLPVLTQETTWGAIKTLYR